MVKNPPANAGDTGSSPGRGAEIPHASRPKNQNIKQNQCCNRFNKDFKNGPHQKQKAFKKIQRNSLGSIKKEIHFDILLWTLHPTCQ